jgi:hypothetical protein
MIPYHDSGGQWNMGILVPGVNTYHFKNKLWLSILVYFKAFWGITQ